MPPGTSNCNWIIIVNGVSMATTRRDPRGGIKEAAGHRD